MVLSSREAGAWITRPVVQRSGESWSVVDLKRSPVFVYRFDEEDVTAAWDVSPGVATVDSALTITPSALGVYPAALSKGRFRLVDAAMAVNVQQLVSGGDASYETFIEFGLNFDNRAYMFWASWAFEGGVLSTAGGDTHIPVALTGTYSHAAEPWWRIRDEGGTTVFFETSADGIAWTSRGSATHTWASESCYLGVKAGYWAGTPTGLVPAKYSETRLSPT